MVVNFQVQKPIVRTEINVVPSLRNSAFIQKRATKIACKKKSDRLSLECKIFSEFIS